MRRAWIGVVAVSMMLAVWAIPPSDATAAQTEAPSPIINIAVQFVTADDDTMRELGIDFDLALPGVIRMVDADPYNPFKGEVTYGDDLVATADIEMTFAAVVNPSASDVPLGFMPDRLIAIGADGTTEERPGGVSTLPGRPGSADETFGEASQAGLAVLKLVEGGSGVAPNGEPIVAVASGSDTPTALTDPVFVIGARTRAPGDPTSCAGTIRERGVFFRSGDGPFWDEASGANPEQFNDFFLNGTSGLINRCQDGKYENPVMTTFGGPGSFFSESEPNALTIIGPYGFVSMIFGGDFPSAESFRVFEFVTDAAAPYTPGTTAASAYPNDLTMLESLTTVPGLVFDPNLMAPAPTTTTTVIDTTTTTGPPDTTTTTSGATAPPDDPAVVVSDDGGSGLLWLWIVLLLVAIFLILLGWWFWFRGGPPAIGGTPPTEPVVEDPCEPLRRAYAEAKSRCDEAEKELAAREAELTEAQADVDRVEGKLKELRDSWKPLRWRGGGGDWVESGGVRITERDRFIGDFYANDAYRRWQNGDITSEQFMEESRKAFDPEEYRKKHREMRSKERDLETELDRAEEARDTAKQARDEARERRDLACKDAEAKREALEECEKKAKAAAEQPPTPTPEPEPEPPETPPAPPVPPAPPAPPTGPTGPASAPPPTPTPASRPGCPEGAKYTKVVDGETFTVIQEDAEVTLFFSAYTQDAKEWLKGFDSEAAAPGAWYEFWADGIQAKVPLADVMAFNGPEIGRLFRALPAGKAIVLQVTASVPLEKQVYSCLIEVHCIDGQWVERGGYRGRKVETLPAPSFQFEHSELVTNGREVFTKFLRPLIQKLQKYKDRHQEMYDYRPACERGERKRGKMVRD